MKDYEYIGIDGEGQGSAEHFYTMICASNADGTAEWSIDVGVNAGKFKERKSLTTVECLDFILELPNAKTRIFSYAFNYDLTKILTDVDNETLYYLFRPDQRKPTRRGPTAVAWPREAPRYELNIMGSKFTVRGLESSKTVVVWDLFKFFQSKFVTALKDWQVGNPELWDRMSGMKNKRGEFDKLTAHDVKAYCFEEVRCMAQLGKKLVESHEQAGLDLTTFYGAGSSGTAMLKKMNVEECMGPSPEAMREAVSSAFSGGRFENSVIGAIPGPLHNWDISSAYPYHTTFLPCLRHGRWRHTTRRAAVTMGTPALVRYTLGSAARDPLAMAWGPFPFRERDGSISYPIESGGGWVWSEEYIAGEETFSHVQFREAWVYQRSCECKPFAKIPEYYKHRLQIGKEGAGLVIKLGVNSCYGKLAQSVGKPKFNSWIWAGMITSGTRAQILRMMQLHNDPSNMLMIATDGILTRETLNPPAPKDTGTAVVIHGKSKPLGGWEHKLAPRGMFIARPGIYFPLDPTEEEIQTVRARGLGRSVIQAQWRLIVEAWERDGVKALATVANVQRFCGAKTSISMSKGGYKRASRSVQLGLFGEAERPRKPAYGQWVSRPVEMSFDPMPKRSGVNSDGLTLTPRKFARDVESVPYSRAMRMGNAEGIEMICAKEEIDEQPDGDFSE